MSRFSNERKSLPRQVADFILEEIIQGRGACVLPGERLLAEEAGVSRQTVQEALLLLENEDVLLPKEGRKARRVAEGNQTKASKTKVLLYLRNKGLVKNREIELSEKRYFQIWEEAGGSVVVKDMDYIYHKQPPSNFIKRMIQQYGVSAVVLDIAPETWITGVLEAGISLYCRGGKRPEGVKLSGIGYEMTRTLREVLEYSGAKGHKRVLVPCDAYFSSVIEDMRRVYRAVQQVSEKEAELFVPHFMEGSPQVWVDYWDTAFTKLKPTIVICVSIAMTTSLISYCNMRKLSIPGDVSVLVMDYNESLTWFQPALQMMAYPYERSDKHFERWVKGGLQPIGMKIFNLEMQPDGASVKDIS